MPTFTICEPSIDPFTVRESIFQALHNQSTCVTERPADHSRDHARDPPKETVAPLYLRKFVKAQVLDASGITRFGTIMVNHLKEDEAVVSHVVQRTVMMVIESPKPPSPTPTMLIGKTAVFVWIAFLYMLKLVYWVMFMYSSYWFWDKFVVQI